MKIEISLKDVYDVLKQHHCLTQTFHLDPNSSSFNQPVSLQTYGEYRQNNVSKLRGKETNSPFIFLFYKGVHFDPHSLLSPSDLREMGVRGGEGQPFIFGLIIENPEIPVTWNFPTFLVKNAREAWAFLCAFACKNPQNDLKMVAITGTNGKSSTTWMAASLAQQFGIKAAVIGTLGVFIPATSSFQGSPHTTPDPPYLYSVLQQMKANGIQVVFMEASSHAIDQKRLAPIKFDAAAWTSFSQDHLDYHHNMQEYFRTKNELFLTYLKPSAYSLLNASLFNLPYSLAKNESCEFYGFDDGLRHIDWKIKKSHMTKNDIEFYYKNKKFQGGFPYQGDFNRENFVAAFALVSQFVEISEWNEKKLWQVPGRLQAVQTEDISKPQVYVDFAHTPEGLEKSIQTLRTNSKGQIFLVFGCGGDRDPHKRPIMGAIAAREAHKIFLTSDNPRSESPDKIINEILMGIPAVDRAKVALVQPNRKLAIMNAIQSANPLDIVLIAGKGHEKHIQLENKKIPFKDEVVARYALKRFTS